jgi:hypothetical protein
MQNSLERILKIFPSSNQYFLSGDWSSEFSKPPTMKMIVIDSAEHEPENDPNNSGSLDKIIAVET